MKQLYLLGLLLFLAACGTDANLEDSELNANNKAFAKKPVVAGIDKIPVENMDEIRELGVGHYKVNVLLNRYFRTKPTKGFKAFKASNVAGKSYYFSENAFADFDKELQTARQKNPGLTLAFVILAACAPDFKLPNIECPAPGTKKTRTKGTRKYPAHFYLPDVKTVDGKNFYRAMMDFLAKKYANPNNNKPFVKYWIMHNEVDIFDEWTHAGDMKMGEFMTLYMETVKIASNALKKYSNQSEAFISITKAWNHSHNALHAFAPKQMMSWLINYEKKLAPNQRFKWGIAQHPYGSTPWKQKPSTKFSLDTTAITMNNVELLDQIASCPSMKFKGKNKTVILSEQGFGSNGATTEAIKGEKSKQLGDEAWVCKPQPNNPNKLFACASEGAKDQAAAILYTFAKLRYTPNIKAFHYHRYQDHPAEKATFGIVDKKGQKKLGFYVLKALQNDAGNAFQKNQVLFQKLWNYMGMKTSGITNDQTAKKALINKVQINCSNL